MTILGDICQNAVMGTARHEREYGGRNYEQRGRDGRMRDYDQCEKRITSRGMGTYFEKSETQ